MKLDLQKFSEAQTYEASVTLGSRLFIHTALPISTEHEVFGIKETSEKGGTQEKVDVTPINAVRTVNALGRAESSEYTLTVFYDDVTVEKFLALIGKEVYIYEEYEDTSANPTLIGSGIVGKYEMGGLTIGGQSSNQERTFTVNATLISDEEYYAKPTGGAGMQEFTYTGIITGKVAELN